MTKEMRVTMRVTPTSPKSAAPMEDEATVEMPEVTTRRGATPELMAPMRDEATVGTLELLT